VPRVAQAGASTTRERVITKTLKWYEAFDYMKVLSRSHVLSTAKGHLLNYLLMN
jgi:hypothetical protein